MLKEEVREVRERVRIVHQILDLETARADHEMHGAFTGVIIHIPGLYPDSMRPVGQVIQRE